MARLPKSEDVVTVIFDPAATVPSATLVESYDTGTMTTPADAAVQRKTFNIGVTPVTADTMLFSIHMRYTRTIFPLAAGLNTVSICWLDANGTVKDLAIYVDAIKLP
jgi:hypothetical protein